MRSVARLRHNIVMLCLGWCLVEVACVLRRAADGLEGMLDVWCSILIANKPRFRVLAEVACVLLGMLHGVREHVPEGDHTGRFTSCFDPCGRLYEKKTVVGKLTNTGRKVRDIKHVNGWPC